MPFSPLPAAADRLFLGNNKRPLRRSLLSKQADLFLCRGRHFQQLHRLPEKSRIQCMKQSAVFQPLWLADKTVAFTRYRLKFIAFLSQFIYLFPYRCTANRQFPAYFFSGNKFSWTGQKHIQQTTMTHNVSPQLSHIRATAPFHWAALDWRRAAVCASSARRAKAPPSSQTQPAHRCPG
ncbi:hypothetical protein D3C77_346670 [compost metagenome]